MNVIIYLSDEGTITTLFPTGEYPDEETAKKDVPAGKPYLIVDRDSLPDIAFQHAWVVDFAKPDGVGLGHDAWLKQYVDPMALYEEAHNENARLDMWPVLIEMAEQENRQLDALQAMKVAS